MPVSFQNYEFSFQLKGRAVFVPSADGRDIGERVKSLIENRWPFDDSFFHFLPGGHVRALHIHREQRFFSRIDLQNFFYSVGRNRVKNALKEAGIKKAEYFAKWSTVKNPYAPPSYSIPYGFVQSPILASLALLKSEVGIRLHRLPLGILKSVYMDDIVLSSDDLSELTAAYEVVKESIRMAGFQINEEKATPPSDSIVAFNCRLKLGLTEVTEDRIAEFHEVSRSPESITSFDNYCGSVAAGNRA